MRPPNRSRNSSSAHLILCHELVVHIQLAIGHGMCEQMLHAVELLFRSVKASVVAHEGNGERVIGIGVGPLPAASHIDVALAGDLNESDMQK